MKLSEFIKENKISMKSVHGYARHYTCTFKHEGRIMRTPFSRGSGIQGDPEIEDVLSHLADDAAGFENSDGFEDWASDYGYDTDSREAERVYKAVQKQSDKLKRFMGEENYKALLWETERG